jgi:predicted Zn finger-like uncharacterized protein
MKIICPNCNTSYQINAAKIPDRGAHTRCKKCQTRFRIEKPQPSAPAAEPQQARPTAAASPKPDVESASTPAAPTPAAAPTQPLSEEERQIEQLVTAGKEDEAAKQLLEMIKQSARQKEFAKAEALRDTLYDVAPLALNEIVGANEIIEEEKSKSIDPEHLKIWAELYNALENDEASELYYAMQQHSMAPEQLLIEKGQQDSNLYFVQNGLLQMVYYSPKQKKNVVIKDLLPGQVVNSDAFFSFTVCTSTVRAAKNSQVGYLEQSLLERWKGRFAGIEPKLQHFCHTQESVADLVKKAGIDMRADPRFMVSLQAMLQFLDGQDTPTAKPFGVALFDISAGGVSFGMKINKRKEAAKLLGQQLMVQTDYSLSGSRRKVSQKGKIVAAHLQPFGESAVHVQFDEKLPDETMKEIEKLSEQPADKI